MTNEGYLEPFVNELTFALSPHGYLVSGYTSEYAVMRLDRDGNAVSRFVRDFEPVRLNREERAQWQARADFYTRRGGASAGAVIPEEKPAFRALEVDDDGRIWVHRYAPAVEHPRNPDRPADQPPELTWRDKPTFDVFESDGRFLGSVQLPPRTRILVRRGRQLYGVTRGEFDEPYVVGFRLETGSVPDAYD
jgi:hypothetical protein